MHQAAANQDPWYRLDNAGKIFSSISSRRVTTLFRLSATLREPVHVGHLGQALTHLMERFPYFAVQLRRGFFWYYLNVNEGVPPVVADSRFPCVDYRFKKRGRFPFRVRAYRQRIAVEFAHALTDGTGAVQFLRALLAEYLRLHRGLVPDDPGDLMRPGQEPHPEEPEDAFRRYWQPGIPPPRPEEPAYHLPHRLEQAGIYRVSTGIMPVAAAVSSARERGVSLTELLIAIYLDAFQQAFLELPPDRRRRLAAPIRLDIPVNLRQHFPSATMRNFFLPVLPAIDPRLGEYSFTEILQKVHHFMRSEIDEKYLRQQMARNVRAEINPFIRVVPLVIKDLVLSQVYDVMAQGRTTSGLSNLGRVTMPAPLDAAIERFEFIPPPPTVRKIACGVISYGDTLYLTFGRTIREAAIERHVFRALVRMGVPVKLETNDQP